MLPHSPQKRLDVIKRLGVNQLAIAENQANPEIVHEDGEASHHGSDANWPSKLITGWNELKSLVDSY